MLSTCVNHDNLRRQYSKYNCLRCKWFRVFCGGKKNYLLISYHFFISTFHDWVTGGEFELLPGTFPSWFKIWFVQNLVNKICDHHIMCNITLEAVTEWFVRVSESQIVLFFCMWRLIFDSHSRNGSVFCFKIVVIGIYIVLKNFWRCTPTIGFYYYFLEVFLMWTILKFFIVFVTILLLFYVSVFWPLDMWDLNSLTRDRTHIACSGRQSSNY